MSDIELLKQKKIYTYYEETELPPYVRLCLKTWQKNIPEGYEIVVLNKDNILDFVSKDLLPDKRLQSAVCSFPYFIDYIAALVLYSCGGIFLEPDTIMTEKFNPNEILLKNTNLVVFSEGQNKICTGYMMANTHSKVLEELIRRYRFSSYLPQAGKFDRTFLISDVIKDFLFDEAIALDCEDTGYLMEKTMYGIANEYLYKKYYFTDICSVDEFFENSKGLTALHDSVTPREFRLMSEGEFLKQDILLSKIFNRIITLQMS